MSTFDDNFPAKGNPKMSDRVFGFDSESLKNAGMTNQALYDLFKGELDPTLPKIADFLPAFDLSNARVMTSTAPDGKIVKSNVLDPYTKGSVTFKEVSETPTIVDGIINILQGGKYYKRVIREYNLGEFNVLPENSASQNATNFAFAQTVIESDSKVVLPTGTYQMNDIVITKSGVYDFSGVTIVNRQEVAGGAITTSEDADFVIIVGLDIKYEGIFYRGSQGHTGPEGVSKHGISINSKTAIVNSCRATRFSNTGIIGQSSNSLLMAINCICNNNGEVGIKSNFGGGLQVIGGEYNENGGAEGSAGGYGDGYGIVGNVALNGNFKVIGATVIGNRTRGIDSHTGQDIIISDNYVTNSGVGNEQWFNVGFPSAHNIRLTQRIKNAVITGNVSKRATFSGIAIDAQISNETEYIRDVLIANNNLEDNLNQIYIRPNKTNRVVMSGNSGHVTGEVEFQSEQADVLISPYLDPEGIGFIKELTITGNSFDGRIFGNFSGFTEINKINISGNSAKSISLNIQNNTEADITISINLHTRLSVAGGNEKSTLNYTSNTQDKEGGDDNFANWGNFAGFVKFNFNILKNSNASTLLAAKDNCEIMYNTFAECNSESTVEQGIRSSSRKNVKIIGNDFKFVNPPTYSVRANIDEGVIIKDNTSNSGVFRTEYLNLNTGNISGVNNPDFMLVDTVSGAYRFGLTTPTNIDFSFKNGDKFYLLSPIQGGNEGWVYRNGIWIPFGFSKREISVVPTVSPTLIPAQRDRYVYFTSVSQGTATIPPDTFEEGDELQGEIEGGAKTFVAGDGVTLRYPDGQGLIAPTGSRFIVKFKSANDALATIIKPQTASSSADTTTPASGSTPTKAEFDALLNEFRDLKTKMRNAGLLAT